MELDGALFRKSYTPSSRKARSGYPGSMLNFRLPWIPGLRRERGFARDDGVWAIRAFRDDGVWDRRRQRCFAQDDETLRGR
jgi:hypothetical protein